MAKKKSVFEEPEPDDFTPPEEATSFEAAADPVIAEEVVTKEAPRMCGRCNSSGAIVVSVINGAIDKYGECPKCVPCPAKCDGGKVPNTDAPCPSCYNGRVAAQ